ncbi:hypothetical protein Rumeso_03621 [Rubellimicrobium mesophilum DSM 19309]|uniref:DUF2269 family protein n=1 Tax=Rubellimicrobium mesophilum DSM 19309 TaxID=442562 RepID=A0A017HM00_9RHOB|nr:DUF2269 family protein [Rubellimicrobium mesophilum]EYD74809.1 hypothetical protein Rumeso_03621 [Rubellimicrobium mesophilum DSM 19309]
MELYLLLKFVHVVGAILWVGGAAILTLLVVILDRRGDDRATLTGVSYVGLLGNKVFAPLGMLVILLGLVLAWLGGYGFAAWTVLAAAIVACTFLLGAMVLGPTCERTVRIWEDTGEAALCIGMGRRVLRLVKLDLGGQFAIIALMVLKPGWTDPLLLVPALILALGGFAYLRGAPAPAVAQAA